MPGLAVAPCRWVQLSSNVRHHQNHNANTARAGLPYRTFAAHGAAWAQCAQFKTGTCPATRVAVCYSSRGIWGTVSQCAQDASECYKTRTQKRCPLWPVRAKKVRGTPAGAPRAWPSGSSRRAGFGAAMPNTSLKLSANGVAHWPSGAGPAAHFAPAVQCATPSSPA